MRIKKISKVIILMTISMLILFGSQMAVFAVGDTWVTKDPMTTNRSHFGVCELNGKIYVVGGTTGGDYLTTFEEYNPLTDTWVTKKSMPEGRSILSAVALNGKIYALGGHNASGVSVKTTYEYDFTTDTWIQKSDMNNVRSYFDAVVLNEKIYVVSDDSAGTIEEYDPINDIWTVKTTIPTTRGSLGATVVNDKIYVIGGYRSGTFHKTVEEYDPITNVWAIKADMPTARNYLGVTSINNKIFAIAGYDGTNDLNTVEEYDVTTNTWVTRANMAMARNSLGVVAANNKIYAMGGAYLGANRTNTVEEYTPSIIIPDIPILSGTAGNAVVNLSWNSISDATGYNVKRGTTSGDWTIIANGITETTYTDTNVTNGTTYYYVVTAVNAGGESAESNEVVLTPQDPDAFTGNKAILTITMSNDAQKEYDMTIIEINNFLDWFDSRANEIGKAYYLIKKAYNVGPFVSRRDYVIFEKIVDFEICDYNQ